MSPRRRKFLKAVVMTGSIVTAPVAIVTAALARDQTGWQLTLTLGAGGLLIAASVALQYLYQWIQRGDERLDIELATNTDYPSLPRFTALSSWIDRHIEDTERGMLSVLDEKIKWQTRRTTGFDAADPEGWRRVTHESPIRDLEVIEQRSKFGDEVPESETLMLNALDQWRKRPVLGLPCSATFISKDKRTITQYRTEVADYLRGYRTALHYAALEVYVNEAIGVLALKVINHGEKPVEALDITITLPHGVDRATKPRKRDLVTPRRVLKFGDVNYGMDIGSHNRYLALADTFEPTPDDNAPRIDDRSLVYTDLVVTSSGEIILPQLHLMTHASAAQVFDLEWDAAAKKSTPGRCGGTIRIRVNNTAISADRKMESALKALGEI